MPEDERLAVIESVFACSRDSAAALAVVTRELVFESKAVVAHQGDVSRHCWLVVDGSVQARILTADGQATLLAAYGPGEILGCYPEPAVLRTDIVAQGAVRLFGFEVEALAAFGRDHADVASGLAVLFARQLDVILDRMAARTTLSATGRVYAELERLAGASNRIVPPPVLSALALTAYTTRETTSRAIGHLVRRGIIRRSDEALEIVAPRMLAELIA